MLKMIFAAGGVVSRQTQQGQEIAVIHRPRYNDWCLPKGKLKDDESWEKAAVREIKEEIGCDVRIIDFIGTTNYKDKGVPKVVFFYNMAVEGECLFQPSEEVDKVLWLAPKEAFEKINYAEEKSIIDDLYNIHEKSSPSGFLSRIRAKSNYYRLSSTVNTYREELENRISKISIENAPNEHWVKSAYNLLALADKALKARRIDEGWRYFHAARRMEIFDYDADELKYAATILRREAEKLKSWRGKATHDLLGEPGKDNSSNVLDNDRVYHAATLRDENYDNEYYKIGLRRANLFILAVILGLAVVSLPVLSGFGILPIELGDWKEILAIEVFGVLGATFSVALTLTRRSVSTAIPDQVIGSFITWMRPLIGAAAAVAMTVLMRSGVLEAVISEKLGFVPGIFGLAFASGFSERLVVSALGKISTEEKKETEEEKT